MRVSLIEMASSSLPVWNFRPTALVENYASRSSLVACYQEDNQKAVEQGVALVSPRPPTCQLRTWQWNINAFAYRYSPGGASRRAEEIGDLLVQADADVVILNEFGAWPFTFTEEDKIRVTKDPQMILSRVLSKQGYTLHGSNVAYPTVIATRLGVSESTTFSLDHDRGAVGIKVKLGNSGATGRKRQAPDARSFVWVYGTHLECDDSKDGMYRLKEAKVLLHHIKTDTEKDDSVIVVGDLNQQ